MRFHEFQYWPLSLGEWFTSSIDPLEFAEAIKIGTDPYEIEIQGYNTDDTYPHTVWVALEIDRSELTEGMVQFLRDVGVTT